MFRKIKKIEHESLEHEGSWAISYGDMITVLLSFFVLFFTFDTKKEQQVDKNILKKFSKLEKEDHKTIVKKSPNGKLIVFFKGASFFDLGSVNINKKGTGLLDKFITKYLSVKDNYKIKVQAFTDNGAVSIRAKFKDNVELSALRSISVMRYLHANGIPLGKTEISGQGKMSKKTQTLLGLKKITRTISLTLYKDGDAS